MSYDVFISYASEDETTARTMVNYLQGRGIRCWIDQQNLRFTGKFDREIEKAIRRSSVVLWLASTASLKSDYVKSEIITASNRDKLIGPVYLEPINPNQLPPPFNLKLANVQGIEWFKGTEEANLEKLAAEVRGLIRGLRKRQAAKTGGILAAALMIMALGLWGVLTRQQGAEPGDPQHAIPAATPFPARLEQLPAAEVLKIAYGESPSPASVVAQRPAIQMAILARRAGESAFSVLNDGDSLASERDDYFLVLRPLSRGYLYVFQLDSCGKKTWLFPRNETSEHSSGINPVEKDKVLQIPAADSKRVFFLDKSVGIEHVYAVFSAVRWPNLEWALRHSVAPTPKSISGDTASLAAMKVQSTNGLALRGVGGTRVKGKNLAISFVVERTDRQQTLSVPVTGAPVEASGILLVVERWFRHIER